VKNTTLEIRPSSQPFTVCFDQHEADFGDYDTLAQARKAIDRFLKEAGE
jgi:hypothetical protein